MKIHNDFTLYFRVVPSGKRVVYYYAYDENGRRLVGRSTGETTLTAARVKCNRLMREGALVPKQDYVVTFAEYAKGWWEWETCAYLKKRRKRANLTQGYAHQNKKVLDNHLLDYFGSMPMDKITQEVVEGFVDSLINKEYRNTTVNTIYSSLKTMLIEAVERKVIDKNPTEKMRKLVKNQREIRIITPEEFKKLFTGNWRKVWDNDRVVAAANKLAALTGMRAGEVLGLKGAFVYDEHIYLCKQYDDWGYRDTKTKDKHNIPLPAALIADLNELKKINGDGFVFSVDGGATPVSRYIMYTGLHKALRSIGMTDTEIKQRRLHLHGWRHFFNTELLKGGLSIPQAQAITGHKSDRMTEWYCHFDASDFAKAKAVQETLLCPEQKKPDKKAEKAGGMDGAGKNAKVLPFPKREAKKQGRQAQ